MGMDVIWTGEFANAGWIKPVPKDVQPAVTRNVFDSVLKTAHFEDRLYAVPIWSNTQLLWYRKDRVKQPPKTWDEMIKQAEKIGPGRGASRSRATPYEGLTVWVNSLIASAGTSILSGPTTVALDAAQTERPLKTMGAFANSPVAADQHRDLHRGHGPPGLRVGELGLHDQLPVRLPVGEGQRARGLQADRRGEVPAGRSQPPSKPPLGGINSRVSSYSKHQAKAFAAAKCLAQPENQLAIAKVGGLPPVRSDVYDRPGAQQDRLPRLRRPHPDVDQGRGGAPVRVAGLPGPLAGDPGRGPPVDRHRPEQPEAAYNKLKDNVQQGRRLEGAAVSTAARRRARRGRASAATARQVTDRARAERKLGLDAVRARGDRDAAGHRLSDRLRDLPVAADARTCASPTRAGSSASATTSTVLGVAACWWEDVFNTVFITVVSVAHRAGARDGARADHAPGDLRPRRWCAPRVLIPYGIVTVVAAFAWCFAFDPASGFVNRLPLIPDDTAWFGQRFSSFVVIIAAEVWKTTPFMALLLLAGLATIDDEPLRGGAGRRRDAPGSASGASRSR